jgi:hypothetical protein
MQGAEVDQRERCGQLALGGEQNALVTQLLESPGKNAAVSEAVKFDYRARSMQAPWLTCCVNRLPQRAPVT